MLICLTRKLKVVRITFPILLSIVFACYFNSAFARTYYFSSTSGDDSRTSAEAQNYLTPWRTLTKFNSFFTSIQSGDSALFKRGDFFYGNIVIGGSGLPGLPFVIGAYGTGAKPVISGFKTISAWTNLGSNIWESTSPVSSLSTINMVVINGVNTPMGRYPNSGYLTYTAPTTTTKTVATLSSATKNWKGATAVMRLHHWITDNNLITAHVGSVLTHATTPNPTSYPGISGYGLFIQNDARTLDVQNEWYYNPSTKKLKIYSISPPVNVQVSTIDTLVTLPRNRGYITIENIKFTGSNKNHFTIISCPNVTIQNCQFDYAGMDAIWGGQNGGAPYSPNFKFLNNTVNHTNNNAILLREEFTNSLIQNNTFDNTALQPGMGKGGDGQMVAIRILADGTIIERNTIDSTGYVPVYFLGDNVQVRYNLITWFNMTKMDGGGIYTWLGPGTPNKGCRIHHNIVLNSYPSTAGTNQPYGLSHGIYMDANTANIQIDSNTVANMSYGGLYLYSGASNNNIFGNTFYNNGRNQMLQTNQFTNGRATKSNLIKNNLFISKSATQYVAVFKTKHSLAAFTTTAGTFNNNYYARPIDDNLTIGTVSNNSTFINHTLSQWKSVSGQDANSNKSPLRITDANDLRFEYNGTNVNKTISLPFNYVDVRGATYNGKITLKPFTSLVLIKSGTATPNKSPTANAGQDKTFTLPTNEITLLGSGTDPDGIISAYSWAKISGPIAGTITSPNSDFTSVTSLAQGIYLFQLKVTDNKGATGFDSIQITVIDAQIGVKAYPNPIGNSIIINVTGGVAGEYKLLLVDASGNIVWTKRGITNSGSFQQIVNSSALRKGIYILKVIQSNNDSVIKMVK